MNAGSTTLLLRSKRWRYLPVVLIFVMSTGCIPMDVWVTPLVQGTVLDAVTNAPISNANVSVISDKTGATATALTYSAGHFEAKPATGTEWRAMMFDYTVPNARMKISAAGYESQETDFYTFEKSRRVYLKPR